MAAKNAVCPACGSKSKSKRFEAELLPPRVWCCLECDAVYRVSRTHQQSLWRKEKRRRDEGRVPLPFRTRFNSYLVVIISDDQGHERVEAVE